jgi:hypothetical protein
MNALPQTEQLAAILGSGGADVVRFWHRGGHELGEDEWKFTSSPLIRALPSGPRNDKGDLRGDRLVNRDLRD